MNLKEFEGKALFCKFGIPISKGWVVRDVAGAKKAAESICEGRADNEECVVLKVQIPFGKRGKFGGILFAAKGNVEEKAGELLGKRLHGFVTSEILVDEKLEIEKEMYLSITLDRFKRCMTMIFVSEGGMEIEEISEKYPERIVKICFEEGFFNKEEIEQTLFEQISQPGLRGRIVAIAEGLFNLVMEKDALLAEINPLVITADGRVLAADSKVTIDDNAIFRHKEFEEHIDMEKSELEKMAYKLDLAYVELDGDIAVIGNGAGMVMATLDMIQHFGGRPANFCDIGGGTGRKVMEKALEIVTGKSTVRKIFVNIFGGITHCDEIAAGILNFLEKSGLRVPVVARMTGTNSAEAREMLASNGIKSFETMEEGVKNILNI